MSSNDPDLPRGTPAPAPGDPRGIPRAATALPRAFSTPAAGLPQRISRGSSEESRNDRRGLERALELAERGRGTTHPNPLVGAVVAREGRAVGEGWHERAGGPHAEVVALGEAGERARGATLYVTLEPCSHEGRTPPCVDAVIAAGVARVVVGASDPTPGQLGVERLRAVGVEAEVVGDELGFRARAQNEAWRTWVTRARPFVTFKVAVTVDGRVVVPGERWVSGEESRRLVHELRAGSDAVAVGMGTVHADEPKLTARGPHVLRPPRRLAFGRGPLPDGSELELRPGPLAEELQALASEGVQSLLLEGGPTLATAFIRAGFVDKLLVFVAPVLSGHGPRLLTDLDRSVDLQRLESRRVGDDVLLSAYVNEP